MMGGGASTNDHLIRVRRFHLCKDGSGDKGHS